MNVKEEIAAGRVAVAALQGIAESALIGSALYLSDVSDIDIAVMLVDGNHAIDWACALVEHDSSWQHCAEYDSVGGTWCAVRRGDLNLMVTHERKFFDGFKLAMEVCKVLRLESKLDRIAVCQVVRDGWPADVVRPRFDGVVA